MSNTATEPLQRIGVGIDTARYGHRVCFLRPDHQPAAKPLTVLENHAGYQDLRQRLELLHDKHPQAHFHVRIDAAGQYAANLEHFLRSLPLPLTISIGEPKRNKDYQKAHFPKRTTDDTESQAMARFAVVEQPQATLPVPPPFVLLREIASRLQAQVKQSTQAVNRLHNLLARVFPELATLADDFSAVWVLNLLDRYPTPARLGKAQRRSLEQIPYLPEDQVEPLHQAAKNSVGSLQGDIAETLVRELVAQVRHCQQLEDKLRDLLANAFEQLPPGGHRQLRTIPGIGTATAAVLVAKIIDIERFATPEALVGYFGVFPQEESSGVDKDGKPHRPGSLRMSHKGNDLVRSYLWNAARSASVHNPAVRALYQRLKAKGKRGDVTIGHCMRKLLHLVYAVWKTNRPFDAEHFAWEGKPKTADSTAAGQQDTPPQPAATRSVTPTTPVPTTAPESPTLPGLIGGACGVEGGEAVGHTQGMPAQPVVTTASDKVGQANPSVNEATPPTRPRGGVDYAYLREQITIEAVLVHLGRMGGMRGRRPQLRGCCPIHDVTGSRERTFSVNVEKNVFQCFASECSASGNVLDLWAAVQGLPLYEAANHLAETFGLRRNREEEPVPGTRGRATAEGRRQPR